MGRIDDRLWELGLVLPEPMEPPGNFELVTMHGGVAYIAGHAPIDGSTVLVQGVVGTDVSLEDGYRAARLTGLSMLASLDSTALALSQSMDGLRALATDPKLHTNLIDTTQNIRDLTLNLSAAAPIRRNSPWSPSPDPGTLAIPLPLPNGPEATAAGGRPLPRPRAPPAANGGGAPRTRRDAL